MTLWFKISFYHFKILFMMSLKMRHYSINYFRDFRFRKALQKDHYGICMIWHGRRSTTLG